MFIQTGLREISPIYNLMGLLLFWMRRGEAESWEKTEVRSPLDTILQLYEVITTYHWAINLIFLTIS